MGRAFFMVINAYKMHCYKHIIKERVKKKAVPSDMTRLSNSVFY